MPQNTNNVNRAVKHNNFNLLLHETFGGGFSPTAVLKLRRLARKVARGSVDRTAYSPKYSLSFMSHHAERISLSVVRGVNRAIRSHLATLSKERKKTDNPREGWEKDWPIHVIPAGYYLYSFQDIPAGPSIFQSIFQHILEYMDTDSPSRGRRSSKIAKNLTKSPEVAPKQSTKWIASTEVLHILSLIHI